jgi:dihydrofolate synthase/folylpolyglutamate synthase
MISFAEVKKKLNHLIECHYPASQERFLKKITHNHLIPSSTIITIGGTNGKGTTAILLEAILSKSGYRVGVYTSPHLLNITERFRVNKCTMTEKDFCFYYERASLAYKNEQPNWFELLTYIMLDYFYAHSLDIMILEVGLGGQRDVVNMIEPDVSVITTVHFDHTEILGNTREQIGLEKAGIFRTGKHAICGDADPPASLIQHAEAIKAQLFLQGKDFHYEVNKKNPAQWLWQYKTTIFRTLPIPQIPLQNASTVLMILECLKSTFSISEVAIIEALKTLHVPGRFQCLSQYPTVIIDVAHNPESAMYLGKQLEKQKIDGKTHAIFGMAGRKAVEASIAPLMPYIHSWSLVDIVPEQPCSHRAMAILKSAESFSSVEAALEKAKKLAKKHDRIIIFGSFLTVAAAMEYLCK